MYTHIYPYIYIYTYIHIHPYIPIQLSMLHVMTSPYSRFCVCLFCLDESRVEAMSST